MRIHLAWPDWPLPLHGPILPEEYLALVTMHGTLMLFFVLTVAPQSGFGNLILPAQLGTRHMAFPRLNAAGLWLTALALVTLLSRVLRPRRRPHRRLDSLSAPLRHATRRPRPRRSAWISGWPASPSSPSPPPSAPSTPSPPSSKLRCEGLTWERLPLTVWGWFTAALLSIIAFSVLLAAILLLFCDRQPAQRLLPPRAETSSAAHSSNIGGDGSPLLWLHLFWFFGHPEVYIAILPGMGLTSMVIANFSRRRVFAYRLMIATTLLIGFLGIFVWGHHMFVAGLNPFAGTAFSISTIAIAIPASAKVFSWLATTWGSRPRLTTPMLFALGFVSLFITGGLTGPILAQPILDEYLHNTFFVVAHFHLIMAMAGIFGLFCATYYWAPLLFHRTALRTPRQAPLLGHPPRRLLHLPPHALHRPRRRTPPLLPAHRHRRPQRDPPPIHPAPAAPHHRLRNLPASARSYPSF